MDQNFFWKDWKKPYSTIYQFLLLIFLLSLVLFGLAYFNGSSSVFQWEIVSSVERLLIPIDSLKIHLFEQDINTDNFVIFQKFMGEGPLLNRWTSYTLLGLTAVFVIFYFTIISNLRRFWYFIFSSFAIVILLSLKFEQVLLFGMHNNSGFITALLIYLPLSYYFQAFAPSSNFTTRFLAFTLVTLLLGGLIHFYSGVEDPFFYLGQYGITAPIIITCVFILITAQEFIYLFLRIITGNTSTFSKNNPVHFTVLSLFYIVNLILVWLKNTQIIDWDILYLDAFLLLPVAALIGIWGFRAKSRTLAGILPFYPWGGFLYLIMGTVAFSTLSFFYFNANDPLIEAFEDLIIYSQFGLGSIFFIYILANFYTLIDNNMKVYKVVYDPKRMPYVTANIAGLIGMFALFVKSGFLAYDQASAGYYNGLGDLYSISENRIAAESYYEQGYLYSEQNHRSNYSLGSFYQKQGKTSDALFFYKRALRKKPTPQAYINTSSLYLEYGMLFDALFTLQEASKKFPGNEQVLNNLGLIYAETEILDSAAYFFDRSSQINSSSKVGIGNFSGLVVKHELLSNPDTDSLRQAFFESEDIAVKNNTLVLLNREGGTIPEEINYPELDTLLEARDIALTGNQLISQRYSYDSAFMEDLNLFIEEHALGNFEEELKLSLAIRHYYSGNITSSIQILQELYSTSFTFREKYGLILSKLLMSQKAFDLALPYLKGSGVGQPVQRNLAISLNETGNSSGSATVWEEVSQNDEQDYLAQMMLEVLNASDLPIETEDTSWDDQIKYLFIRYRIDDFGLEALKELALSINNEYLKPMAILVIYDKAAQRDPEQAEQYYELLEANNPIVGFIDEEHLEIHLKRLERSGRWEEIGAELASIQVDDIRLRWTLSYYRGKIAERNGDTSMAEAYFKILSKNPLYEPGLLAAVDYYDKQLQLTEKAYEIILEALQVNENSIPYRKMYSRIATKLGLDNYVESIMEELKGELPKSEYSELETEINEIKSKLEEII